MATTIDNLSVDHHITVLGDFTDAKGVTLRAGQTGILRELIFDQIRLEIIIGIEMEHRNVVLLFPLAAKTGPRNGHMREYFEVGDYAPLPRSEPIRQYPSVRRMIVPPPEKSSAPSPSKSDWESKARNLDGPDRLEDVEAEIQRAYPHIGAAASVAEMYARRMRAFQRAGNEPRAVAAFKLAADWISTYASWATSGGEGAALSYERDKFIAGLVQEFGYDPTEKNP